MSVLHSLVSVSCLLFLLYLATGLYFLPSDSEHVYSQLFLITPALEMQLA